VDQVNWQTVSSGSGTVTSVATTGAITGGTITTSGTIAHSTSAGYKHIPSGGASKQFLKYSSSGTAVWDGGVLDTDNYLHVGHRTTAASGTAGGTLTENTWVTRTLNHTYTNTLGATVEVDPYNRIALATGTYYAKFWAIAHNVQDNQAQLYDSSGGAVLLNGSNEDAGSGATSKSVASGIITISSGPHYVIMRHIVDYTRATYGAGQKLSIDNITTGNFEYNTYWGLEIWKIT